MHGGASVWQTPAVDPELGLIFFSTGNPGPDYNGAVRKGDNLFSASIVAIDAKTGTYKWHFQQVHHDIWDYDGPSPVVLFDLEVNGVLRNGLAQPSKTGWVYVLDRTNGQPLIGIDERPVPQEPRQATAATQPYPRGDAFVPQSISIAPEGFELVNEGKIFTPFWTDERRILKPAISGGVNWPPSSYDPSAGHLFVCAQDRIGQFLAEEIDDSRPPPGERYAAGIFGASPLPSLGVFAALDMRTNELVWQQHWPEPCYSGSVATAGGLVFVGRNDGRLTALDSRDGKKLWEFQTGAGMNAPASVFEHGGKQYVARLLGRQSVRGLRKRRQRVAVRTRRHARRRAARELGDDVHEQRSAARRIRSPASSSTTRRARFVMARRGEGGHGGGKALADARNADVVLQVVSEGRNAMPPFGAALTPAQIRDVSAYVATMLPRQ